MNRPFSKLLPQASARNLRLWVLVGVLIAITQLAEPLAGATLTQELAFWVGRVAAVVLSLAFAEWLVGRLLTDRWNSPAWFKPGVATILIAVIPMTLVEVGLESAIPQAADQDDSAVRELSLLLAIAFEYATIASVLVPLNLVLWLLIDQRHLSVSQAPNIQAPVAKPTFLDKTNAIQLKDVIALSAEEHYVRVHTAKNNELIHYRLSDAVAEMPTEMGLQVHRSWWVTERAVISAKRGDRRYQLMLTNGLTVPVSDSFTTQVRGRGLLRRHKTPTA